MNNLIGKPEHAELQKKLDDDLQAQLKKIGDQFKPRQYYLEKWGYRIAPHGSISYQPGGDYPQSPKPIDE